MKAGKLILQSLLVAVLLLVAGYFLNRTGVKYRLLRIFGGDRLNKKFNDLPSDIDPEATYQAGCPTFADIENARNNGCFTYSYPDSLCDPAVTDCNALLYNCFDPETVLTENLCSLAVLELRNQLDLKYGIDTFDDSVDALTSVLKACYLDSELYATMQELEEPTVNGFLLGQFGYTLAE